ncbi:MAG: EamA-like transporter family protein [Rhodobacteraceae bacterium]|nr:EamA-like transporter family protein [Paracoccaceae bacterium]
MNALVLIIAVILGGALIAAQGPIYARMSLALGGPVQTAMLAFTIGALALVGGLITLAQPWPTRDQLAAVPLWAWFGGLIGVYVVLVSIFAIPRLGVATYSSLVIAGQLTASALFDRFGVFGVTERVFSAQNMLGLVMLALGAVLLSQR